MSPCLHLARLLPRLARLRPRLARLGIFSFAAVNVVTWLWIDFLLLLLLLPLLVLLLRLLLFCLFLLLLPSEEVVKELTLPPTATRTSISDLSADVDYVVTITSYLGSEESLPISGQITRESRRGTTNQVPPPLHLVPAEAAQPPVCVFQWSPAVEERPEDHPGSPTPPSVSSQGHLMTSLPVRVAVHNCSSVCRCFD